MTPEFATVSAIDVVGFVGVGLVVSAYFLSQIGRMDVTRPAFPSLNLIGSALILISLYFVPNKASIAIEGFWLIISAIGLYRALFINNR